MESSNAGRDVGLAFMGGFLSAISVGVIIGFLAMRTSDTYGLGHWKLNAKMPLTTMWMNLGYWTDAKGDRIQVFEEACAGLLREMLANSGILQPESGEGAPSQRSLGVVDLGFGCGDQTWELARLARAAGWHDLHYVGLTLNEAQVQAASRKIYRSLAEGSEWKADAFRLFRADAARPETWSSRAREAVEGLAAEPSTERWVMALDCLYHFNPSRKPIFDYASRKLDVNFMAFDLVLNESASARDRLALRAVGVMMGCPVGTFLTCDEYREQLVECGYDRNRITIRDISEHVFPGVVKFIEDQERALSEYGISLGGFKLAGRLFAWFGRSEVAKAVIVVARAKDKSS